MPDSCLRPSLVHSLPMAFSMNTFHAWAFALPRSCVSHHAQLTAVQDRELNNCRPLGLGPRQWTA